MLLLVSEHGSFRQAALHARVDHATVRTRIDQLQELTGVPLVVHRTPNKVVLTDEAFRLIGIAKDIRALFEQPSRGRHARLPSELGKEPITVSEGIGQFCLVPHLTESLAADCAVKMSLTTVAYSFQGIPLVTKLSSNTTARL